MTIDGPSRLLRMTADGPSLPTPRDFFDLLYVVCITLIYTREIYYIMYFTLWDK